VSEHEFGSGEPFSVGVEEELLLVREDGRPADDADEVLERLPEDLPGKATSELHACEVEVVSPVARTVGEAIARLVALRAAVVDTGARPIGAGLQPQPSDAEPGITPKPRYRRIRDLLGDAAYTPVAGMHVHVGMPDPETAIRAFNGLRRHLPLVHALGANSPYRDGRDAGLASARAIVMRSWVRTGIPRALADFEDFRAMSGRLALATELPDYTFFWWQLRPHPRLGTVEVRTADTQTAPEDAAAIAALVHALARHEAEAPPVEPPPPELLDEGMYRAARWGVEGSLPDVDGRLRPVGAVLNEALALAAPHAAELGCEAELASLPSLLTEGGGAGRQRAVQAREGLDGLVAWLARRTAGTGPASGGP
jgi:carboxylate-amine ligase